MHLKRAGNQSVPMAIKGHSLRKGKWRDEIRTIKSAKIYL